jgi:hypothetical protein
MALYPSGKGWIGPVIEQDTKHIFHAGTVLLDSQYKRKDARFNLIVTCTPIARQRIGEQVPAKIGS